MNKNRNQYPIVLYPPAEQNSPAAEKSSQRYLHTYEVGAGLPAVQAVISGAITFLCILLLGYEMRWRNPFMTAGIFGLLGLGLVWLILQRHWFRLTELERMTGLDLNRDGVIGEAQAARPREVPEVRVRVERVTDEGHFQERIYPLPASLEQLQSLAEGLAQGVPFSERNWTGSGNPFSVAEFRALRSEMIRRGLLALANDKDPRQGYALTEEGEAAMSGFIDSIPSPAADPVR